MSHPSATDISPAQERLWFLGQLDPGSPVLNLAVALRLAGPLDLAVLRNCLAEIARRHPPVRTAFAIVEGRIRQIVHPPRSADLAIVDLNGLAASTREFAAERLMRAAARRPFDPTCAPLLRTLLLRLDAGMHLLLVAAHRMIADEGSLQVFARELGVLYGAFATGKPSPLPDLADAYARLAQRRQIWLESEASAAELAYWRDQFAQIPPVLDLPADRPRPPVQAMSSSSAPFRLPAALGAGLQDLSAHAGVDLFVTVLTAFQTLLHRYTGQTDLIAGAAVANRDTADAQQLIGPLADHLPLRANLAGNPAFHELLARAQQVYEEAYAHRGVPLARILEALPLERSLSYAPLFQATCELREAPQQFSNGDLAIQPAAVPAGAFEFDLSLAVTTGDRPEGHEHAGAELAGAFEYTTALFDPPTVRRMVGHWQRLLEGIAANPGWRLADLPILSRAERQQLLGEWNDTRREVRSQNSEFRRSYPAYDLLTPDSWLLTSAFAVQVARTPDAVAVVFERPMTNDQRPTTTDGDFLPSSFVVRRSSFVVHLTYGELDRRSEQLARYLRRLGVGPDVLVGICVERSAEMVVGLLGILKAGGAYVPLDPTYPAERIAFMLEDSGATVVVTMDSGSQTRRQGDMEISKLHVSLSPGLLVSWSVVDLRADWPAIAQTPPDGPLPAARPENLAYVIYTSGSTGRPKGVMVRQSGLLNLCDGLRAFFDDPKVERVGLITSISFDISVNQIFPTLLFGRALHIITNDVKYDSRALLRYLDDQRIQVLDAVPSYMQSVLADVAPGLLANSLRYLLIGGEKLEARLLQAVFDQLGRQVVIVNIYGLTEITDINAFAVIRAADRERPITIGRPLQHNRIYLLNRYGGLQPIGVVGEVCIAGASLARGYLGQPDLTAERFVPNPFANCKLQIADCRLSQSAICNLQSAIGTRLCRTGDLGRRRADGTIELLGRLDQQVKIRGYRIEIGEIEAALRQHVAVREVAVVAREQAPAAGDHPERRLVAYVVPTTDHRPPTNDHRRKTKDERRKTKPDAQRAPGRRKARFHRSSFIVHRFDHLVSLSACHLVTPHSSLVTRHSSLVTELREFLAERLPDYMIPAAFILLEALPRTPNGKIDRRALPDLDGERPALADAFVAPRGPLEEALAAIWSEVLELDRVGRHDHFFALGGHSLLAAQVVSRVQEVLRVQLPLRALFEAPTLAGLASVIAVLRPGVASPPIARVSRDRALPLSFAQQRLWFLDQLMPESPVYNVPALFRLSGVLDVRALRASLLAIIQRHEVLRTTFMQWDGQPYQVIAPTTRLAWQIADLRALPMAERERRAREQIDQEARKPFALGAGPLLRVLLLRLDDDAYLLLLTIHHIAFDSWSIAVLLLELAALYPAHAANRPASLPELPIQYADYAIWQRDWLQGMGDHAGSPLQEQLLDYWRTQLDGCAALALPSEHQRRPAQRYRAARQALPIPQELFAGLEALGRRANASLFMTLLATFMTLLHRYSGQADIVVGTPIAGRNRADVENLIGFFVNTLPIRADLSGNPRFGELLSRVREASLGAYAHQDLPFEKLVEALRPARDLGHTPLLQVVFALQGAPPPVELPELSIRFVEELDTGTAKFDLTLLIEQREPGPLAILEYDRDLFEAAMIARLLNHFLVVAAAIAANPGQRLGELPLLTAAERAELLTAWNDTRTDYPHDATIHALFAAQAQRQPDAVALVFENRRRTTDNGPPTIEDEGSAFSVQRSAFSVQHLTYATLDRCANQLAHRLRALGVGPDVPVGLCMERSPELIVGILGALKAGGAYLPLDPAYPSERIAFMLEDSGARVVLTMDRGSETRRQGDKEMDELLVSLSPPLLVSCRVVDLHTGWPAIAQESAACPAGATRAEHLALILYTSGSTGAPKGVAIPHRAVSRLICNTNYMQLASADRVAHVSGISFDAATFEIWAALLHGGQLVLIERDIVLAPQQFVGVLRAQRITTMLLTTALFNALARHAPGAFSTVETLMFGGEAADPDCVGAVLRSDGPRRLLHMYGPAESTTYASWHEVRQLPDAASTVPIGTPVANTELYVLDRFLQPVPVGVAGELYIGGAGLAHGYWRRPDLTAERFIPDPTTADRRPTTDEGTTAGGRWSVVGGRLYRTGDLVRRRLDGSLEFLGRSDFQVKLRGFRIEPGEIEAALGKHPSVGQCLVLAIEQPGQGKQLVAYVVPGQGSGVRGQGSGATNDQRPTTNDELVSSSFVLRPSSFVQELRDHLRQTLPDYMVPAAFVFLGAFPLTPNGKIDRGALPAPDRDQLRESDLVAPRTPIEASLAEIWSEVLGVARPSIEDNFFELGGHSLLGTQLLSRLHQVFQVELPLRSLFEAPTIAALALLIVKQQAERADNQTLDELLARLEHMSEEEADALLAAGNLHNQGE